MTVRTGASLTDEGIARNLTNAVLSGDKAEIKEEMCR
jgi:hypothetical protein